MNKDRYCAQGRLGVPESSAPDWLGSAAGHSVVPGPGGVAVVHLVAEHGVEQ